MTAISAPTTTVAPETQAQLVGFHWLHRVWEGFREAVDELSRTVGVPICVDGCGLCCTTNTPSAWGIEVKRAAAWLWEQPPVERAKILDRIENWLLKPVLEVEPPVDPPMTIRNPQLGKLTVGSRQIDTLHVLATTRGRCPMLGDDLRCSVYEVRPLACRAWGVTNFAAHYCKRPQGRGESPTSRAIFAGSGTVNLRASIRALLAHLHDKPKLTRSAFFPTALYAEFRDKRLMELLPRIATTKLTGGQGVHNPRLFEETLDVPLPSPLKTGPVQIPVPR